MPDDSTANIAVQEGEFILQAALQQGVELPFMCREGWCTTCAGRVENDGEWDQSASRRYYPQDREARTILICTAKPLSDLVIQTHQCDAVRDYRISLRLPTPRR